MRPETYDLVAAREEGYWWHRARREMAAGLLRRYGLARGSRALDLGCGTGGNLSIFSSFAPRFVVGIDVLPIALHHDRRKHSSVPLVLGDTKRRVLVADKRVINDTICIE